MRDKGKSKAPDSAKTADEEGKKLIIEHLYIRDGKVHVSATDIQGQTATASLPAIHLTDIGKKTGGATAAEVAEQVLAALSREASRAAATTNIGGLVERAKSGAAGRIGEAAKEGTTGLKGLFGK